MKCLARRRLARLYPTFERRVASARLCCAQFVLNCPVGLRVTWPKRLGNNICCVQPLLCRGSSGRLCRWSCCGSLSEGTPRKVIPSVFSSITGSTCLCSPHPKIVVVCGLCGPCMSGAIILRNPWVGARPQPLLLPGSLEMPRPMPQVWNKQAGQLLNSGTAGRLSEWGPSNYFGMCICLLKAFQSLSLHDLS